MEARSKREGEEGEHRRIARIKHRVEHGITVNWDQSTHGGYDMNVGFVTDIDSSNGAYMRPAAPPYTKKVVVSRVGVG